MLNSAGAYAFLQWLLSPGSCHIHMGVVLRAHPVRGETHSTQCQWKDWNTLGQGLATYGKRSTLGMASNFQWHSKAQNFTHQFCYDSHRRYIGLNVYKKRMLLAH